MPLLNISFGFLAYTPIGWLYMALIIWMENWIAHGYLKSKDKRIIYSMIGSNVISGMAGFIFFTIYTSQCVVFWWPWVGKIEIDWGDYAIVEKFITIYTFAFIGSVLIEMMVNILFLYPGYKLHKVFLLTLLVNVSSYTLGSLFMYGISFDVFYDLWKQYF